MTTVRKQSPPSAPAAQTAAPAPAASLDTQQFRRVEELLHSWDARSKKQIAEVSRVAEDVTALDLELCETVAKLEALQIQQTQAQTHQKEIDAALERIEQHQACLLTALQSMESALSAECTDARHHPLPAAVRSLQAALEDGEVRVRELVVEVNELQTAVFPHTVGQLQQVLNEQQRTLDRLEHDSRQLREKVQQQKC